MAMHVAVSTLSPVSIHTLTPAFRSVSSVELTYREKIFSKGVDWSKGFCRRLGEEMLVMVHTWSCSLSSTPVRPNNSRLHSRSSTALRMDASLSCTERLAASYRCAKARYSFISKYLTPTTRVRSPFRARFPHSSSSQSEN